MPQLSQQHYLAQGLTLLFYSHHQSVGLILHKFGTQCFLNWYDFPPPHFSPLIVSLILLLWDTGYQRRKRKLDHIALAGVYQMMRAHFSVRKKQKMKNNNKKQNKTKSFYLHFSDFPSLETGYVESGSPLIKCFVIH